MSRDGEWGSHIELVALADVVGVPILVTTDCDDDEYFQVWIYPNEQQTDQVMLLGYSCNHYYSLEGNLKCRCMHPYYCNVSIARISP